MGISFIIILLVLLSIFMFTSEGVNETAKRVTLLIGVVAILWIIFQIL